jgi:hypothetical protein
VAVEYGRLDKFIAEEAIQFEGEGAWIAIRKS